jgi:uncharacterized protein YjbI with pentapeptide repeats
MPADPTHDHEETQVAAAAVVPVVTACVHHFAEAREPCPHPVPPEATRCVWHNAAVSKGDAYVARLVAQAVVAARGDLAEARLAGLHAPGIRLPNADLRRADLRDAVLDGADLRGARLAGASLRRASLKRADLTGADLSGADLAGTNFGGAVLDGAALRGATIDGTVLKGASADGADLAGADLRSLRYDRRSRLAQANGLPAELASSLDPVAPAEDDPTADESRVWARGIDHPSSLRPAALAASDLLAMDGPNGPPTPARRRRGPWPWIAAASLMLAIAGTVIGAVGLRASRAVPQDAARLAGELAAAQGQADANLAEVRRLQGLVAKAEEAAAIARTDAARAQDEGAVRRAEAEDFRKRLTGSETELIRLRDADDRAELMALRLAEANRLAREQAEMLTRQERVGGILAQGVRQLRDENAKLDKAASTRQAEERRADLLTAELATVKQELDAVRADRDALATRERRLSGDLADSRTAIQAYLARIAEADLGHVLGDEASRQPLVPVRAGTPIALAGDYLISLRLDQAEGGVSARLVVQRPAATANPDVSVVLYDADQKPLRRLGFGFPHIDRGAPFASASATVACDRFPAFARVIVSPAATAPVGAR